MHIVNGTPIKATLSKSEESKYDLKCHCSNSVLCTCLIRHWQLCQSTVRPTGLFRQSAVNCFTIQLTPLVVGGHFCACYLFKLLLSEFLICSFLLFCRWYIWYFGEIKKLVSNLACSHFIISVHQLSNNLEPK